MDFNDFKSNLDINTIALPPTSHDVLKHGMRILFRVMRVVTVVENRDE